MAATKSYQEALAALSEDDREKFLSNPNRWRVLINGEALPPGTDVRIEGRFGSAETVVVMHNDGTPNFDRPNYAEAPATNIVGWGRDADGEVRMAVIRQPRPHADQLGQPSTDGHAPVLFGQVPMGFLDKVLGGDFETPEEGATHEMQEETGATAILRIERPMVPWQNPNPSFVKSWVHLLFVEVDLQKVEALKASRSEPIYSAEYVTVDVLLERIRVGRDEHGAEYRSAISNSIWLIFFATHPELFRV